MMDALDRASAFFRRHVAFLFPRGRGEANILWGFLNYGIGWTLCNLSHGGVRYFAEDFALTLVIPFVLMFLWRWRYSKEEGGAS